MPTNSAAARPTSSFTTTASNSAARRPVRPAPAPGGRERSTGSLGAAPGQPALQFGPGRGRQEDEEGLGHRSPAPAARPAVRSPAAPAAPASSRSSTGPRGVPYRLPANSACSSSSPASTMRLELARLTKRYSTPSRSPGRGARVVHETRHPDVRVSRRTAPDHRALAHPGRAGQDGQPAGHDGNLPAGRQLSAGRWRGRRRRPRTGRAAPPADRCTPAAVPPRDRARSGPSPAAKSTSVASKRSSRSHPRGTKPRSAFGEASIRRLARKAPAAAGSRRTPAMPSGRRRSWPCTSSSVSGASRPKAGRA